MLKFNLSAEEWNGADEGIKALYQEKDGGYELQVEDLPKPADPPPPAPSDDFANLKSALQKERDKAKELEKQLKSLGKTPEEIKTLLDEYQKHKDADKSEAEKLRDAVARDEKDKADMEARIAEMEASVKAKEVETLRIKVASEKGLPLNLADRLRGETEEDIRADADAMSAFFVPTPPGEPTPPEPPKDKPIGAPGNPPAPKPTDTTVADQIAAGKKRAEEINEKNKQSTELFPRY